MKRNKTYPHHWRVPFSLSNFCFSSLASFLNPHIFSFPFFSHFHPFTTLAVPSSLLFPHAPIFHLFLPSCFFPSFLPSSSCFSFELGLIVLPLPRLFPFFRSSAHVRSEINIRVIKKWSNRLFFFTIFFTDSYRKVAQVSPIILVADFKRSERWQIWEILNISRYFENWKMLNRAFQLKRATNLAQLCNKVQQ